MIRVVDTNVPLVIKFPEENQEELIRACEDIIIKILEGRHPVVTDFEGEIIAEYFHQMERGGPSLADEFAKYVHDFRWSWDSKYNPQIEPDPTSENMYLVLAGDDNKIDPSDRKFVATAKVSQVPIIQARDTKWLDWTEVLSRHGVKVEYAHEDSLRAMYRAKFGRDAP